MSMIENGISPTKVERAVAKNARVIEATSKQLLGKTFDQTDLPQSAEGQYVKRSDRHAISGKRAPGHK